MLHYFIIYNTINHSNIHSHMVKEDTKKHEYYSIMLILDLDDGPI